MQTHRNAGGNRINTAVGLGLTAGLFAFGIVLVGTMVVAESILGGVRMAKKERAPAPGGETGSLGLPA